MSLAFLFKKTWHPSTLQNAERVWIAEQKDAAEKRRIQELTKQVREEQQVRELEEMQAAGGHGPDRKERIDWMYEGPMQSVADQQAEANEYLLGKEFKLKDKGTEQLKKMEETKVPGPLLATVPAVTSANEAFRRVQEDPLLRMRKARIEAEQNVVNNPVKMTKIRMQLEAEMAQKAEKKRAKKEAKKEAKKVKKDARKERKKMKDDRDSEAATPEDRVSRPAGINRRESDAYKSDGRDRHDSERQRREHMYSGRRERRNSPAGRREKRNGRRDGSDVGGGGVGGPGRDRDRTRGDSRSPNTNRFRRNSRGEYVGSGLSRDQGDGRPRPDGDHGRNRRSDSRDGRTGRSHRHARTSGEYDRHNRRRRDRSRSPSSRSTASKRPIEERHRVHGRGSPHRDGSPSTRDTPTEASLKRYGLLSSASKSSKAEAQSLGPGAALLETKEREKAERDRERAQARKRRVLTAEEKERRLQEMEDDGVRNQELKKRRVEDGKKLEDSSGAADVKRNKKQSQSFIDKLKGDQVSAMGLEERMQRNRHYQQRGADVHNFMARG